jgi:hypothetical protein
VQKDLSLRTVDKERDNKIKDKEDGINDNDIKMVRRKA